MTAIATTTRDTPETLSPTADVGFGASEATLRIAFLVGSNKDEHCGVKDYTQALAAELAMTGIEADVYAPRAWDRRSLEQLRREVLRPGRYDVLHVQYPSIGYRYTLLPHTLGFLERTRPTVVTLHEYSALPLAQRLSTHLFRWSAKRLLLVSEYEQACFNRVQGTAGAAQVVIPIGSNIPASPFTGTRDRTVVYFGQIRPHKGLESFLDLAHLSAAQGKPYQFCILGSISGANRDYATNLREKAPPSVRWSCDLSFVDVSEVLARSFAAFLPFPDGASERRGSMLAALLNGLPVLTRRGVATTDSLLEVLLFAETPQAAIETLHLLEEPATHERVSSAGRVYAKRYSWDRVAAEHAELYRGLCPTAASAPAAGGRMSKQQASTRMEL